MNAAGTTAPTRRASALPPGERRAHIIDATLPLLREHGERVTSKQIAEAAGIAEGTIFRVFADKEELLHACLDRALDQEPFERAVRAIDPSLSLEDRLVEATDLIQRRVVEVWTILSRLGPSAHRHAQKPMPASEAIAAIFAADADHIRVDPIAAARMLRALTLSLTHPMIAGEPATASEIVGVLLRGIEAR